MIVSIYACGAFTGCEYTDLFVQNQNHAKAMDYYNVLWKILLVLSIIAAIIGPVFGWFACMHAFQVSENTH